MMPARPAAYIVPPPPGCAKDSGRWIPKWRGCWGLAAVTNQPPGRDGEGVHVARGSCSLPGGSAAITVSGRRQHRRAGVRSRRTGGDGSGPHRPAPPDRWTRAVRRTRRRHCFTTLRLAQETPPPLLSPPPRNPAPVRGLVCSLCACCCRHSGVVAKPRKSSRLTISAERFGVGNVCQRFAASRGVACEVFRTKACRYISSYTRDFL